MGEGKPPTFYANLETVRIAIFGLLAFGLLTSFFLPSIIGDAQNVHARMHAKANTLLVILPLAATFLLFAIVSCVRMLIFNPPVLTIVPEGLRFDAWGLICWHDIQGVVVRQILVDPKRRTTRLGISIEVSNLKTYWRNLKWPRRLTTVRKDWTKPITLFQLGLATPLPTIAAAIEAHRPKPSTP